MSTHHSSRSLAPAGRLPASRCFGNNRRARVELSVDHFGRASLTRQQLRLLLVRCSWGGSAQAGVSGSETGARARRSLVAFERRGHLGQIAIPLRWCGLLQAQIIRSAHCSGFWPRWPVDAVVALILTRSFSRGAASITRALGSLAGCSV